MVSWGIFIDQIKNNFGTPNTEHTGPAIATAMDLRVRLCNGALLHRSVDRGDIFEVCAVLGSLVQNELDRFQSEIEEVRLVTCSHAAKKPHGVVFTNICGKIVHVAGKEIYQPGVKSFVRVCKDGFGESSNLFSADCNLSTHKKNTATLFRGATCTHRVQTVIEHAIREDAIASVTVHMLVATARLGRNVSMHSYCIEHDLTQDPRWTAAAIAQLDHMSYMKSVRIKKFAAALEQETGVPPPQGRCSTSPNTAASICSSPCRTSFLFARASKTRIARTATCCSTWCARRADQAGGCSTL